jgi:hypothetical protein
MAVAYFFTVMAEMIFWTGTSAGSYAAGSRITHAAGPRR